MKSIGAGGRYSIYARGSASLNNNVSSQQSVKA
jgi:hypothetical protein